jgi:hypothetical protein
MTEYLVWYPVESNPIIILAEQQLRAIYQYRIHVVHDADCLITLTATTLMLPERVFYLRINMMQRYYFLLAPPCAT